MTELVRALSGSHAPHEAPLGLRPPGFDPGQEVEVDLAVRDLWRDADFLSVAPKELVRQNREMIEEARERLNDALARVS